MLIIHPTGIDTRLLCPASKRYLSRLLVGTTGINPNFISWKQVLKQITHLYPLLLNPSPEGESARSVHEKTKTWNRLFSRGRLKPQLLKSLTEHEKAHRDAELKKNHRYNLKKKFTGSLLALVISVGIFGSLFLLMPITTSFILISAFIFATVLFTTVLGLDFLYPTIFLKTTANTAACQQRTEITQEINCTAPFSQTENKLIKIVSRPDTKKTPKKHAQKRPLFNNRLKIATHFFHLAHKKRQQQELHCHEMMRTRASNLNQNLCTILSRLD